MQFDVLGPLQARDGDRAVALGGAKQRALLAILLLHANEPVSVDRLVDVLWPGRGRDDGGRALQVAISRLRRALNGASLVTRPPGYELRVEAGQLDAECFEASVADARRALARGDPRAAAARIREALALWRGPPLADLGYHDACRSEIERLEELRLEALELLHEAQLGAGLHASAVAPLERLVLEHPLRERLRAQLMLALYRSGRQADALEAFRAGRAILVEELGIEPGRELRDLHAAILDQDPELDAPRSATPSSGEADDAGAGGFVGRSAELAAIDAALARADEGSGMLLLVRGEAGIGKSRLAEEAARRAAASGAEVLWGRCWEAGGAPAYWPWVQALRGHARSAPPGRVREELGARGADVAAMLPELADLLGDAEPPGPADPETARFRLFDATAQWLRAAGDHRPLLVVLDDLHVADAPSLVLLRFVARELRDMRVVVLAAARDESELPIDELEREPATRVLRLGGLDADATRRCVEGVVGADAPAALTTVIQERSEGNPLFAVELARLLTAPARGAEPPAAALPEGIRGVIEQRLERISGPARALLGPAAVLGRSFRRDVLAQLSGRPADEVLDLLDEAIAAGIVQPGAARGAELRFTHVLLRDAVYGALPTRDRLRLHARAGTVLERHYAADPDPHLAELAHHFLEASPAGGADIAVAYARRAGDRAEALLAHEEAARLYEMALDALDAAGVPGGTVRCELLLAAGEALARGGELPAAKATFADAADEAARVHGRGDLVARAAIGYAGAFVWARAGRDERLVPLIEQALAALPADGDALRARLLARLAGALRDRAPRADRAALARDAVAAARRCGDAASLAWALEAVAGTLTLPRDVGELEALAGELTSVATDSAAIHRVLAGHHYAFGTAMLRGDVSAAENAVAAMRRITGDLREPAQQWASAPPEATLALFKGRLDEAERLIDALAGGSAWRGVRGHRVRDDTTFRHVLAVQHWALQRERGDPASALDAVAAYVEEHPEVFVTRCLLAHVHCAAGARDRALDELRQLLTGPEPLEDRVDWFLGAAVLAEVAADLEDTAAAALLHAALAPYGSYVVYTHPEIALGSAERPLALLAATLGRREEAERRLAAAAVANERMGAVPALLRTREDARRIAGR